MILCSIKKGSKLKLLLSRWHRPCNHPFPQWAALYLLTRRRCRLPVGQWWAQWWVLKRTSSDILPHKWTGHFASPPFSKDQTTNRATMAAKCFKSKARTRLSRAIPTSLVFWIPLSETINSDLQFNKVGQISTSLGSSIIGRLFHFPIKTIKHFSVPASMSHPMSYSQQMSPNPQPLPAQTRMTNNNHQQQYAIQMAPQKQHQQSTLSK